MTTAASPLVQQDDDLGFKPLAPSSNNPPPASQQAKPQVAAPTMGPRTPSFWEGITSPIREGAIGHSVQETMPRIAKAFPSLFEPTETAANPEKQQHENEVLAFGAGNNRPGALKGLEEFVGGMTTAPSILAMAAGPATKLLEPLVGEAGIPVVNKLIQAGFSAEMLTQAARQSPQLAKALQSGDYAQARQIATEMGLSAAFGTHLARGLDEPENPLQARVTPEGRYQSIAVPNYGQTLDRSNAATPEAAQRAPLAALPPYRQPVITPAPRGSVLGSIERAGAIPPEERTAMQGYARREPIGLLPPIRPTFEDSLNSFEGPRDEALIPPEPTRTSNGTILARGRVLGEQRALPAALVAGHLNSIVNGEFPAYDSLHDFARMAEGRLNDAKAAAEFNHEVEKLAAEERESAGKGYETLHGLGPENSPGGILPGLEDATAEQARAAAVTRGERLTQEANRPLGSIESAAGEMETKSPLFRGTKASPQREIFGNEKGGVSPELLRDVFTGKLPKEAYGKFVAEPLISKLGLGEKYAAVRQADPEIADQLHALDNAPAYVRAKAAKAVHDTIGNLSRDQERLFSLMADADSRENLRANHPSEYRQAVNDPAIQDALRKYRPIEQEMTNARKGVGGATLDQDYLRRVYEQHVSGVGKEAAATDRASIPFERVIRPERVPNQSREATAEYHYQNGLHEFGPAFGTKFIGTHLQALRDSVAKDFISKATELPWNASEPRSIEYEGTRYYRPDIAREMGKGTPTYSCYDAAAGLKFPSKTDLAKKYLGPSEIVHALNNYGVESESHPGAVNRFLQEQVVGFGFGIPHVFNILRRVTQSEPGGALNPKSWADAWKVALDKGLRARGIEGLDDPTFDKLAKQGAIAPQEMKQLKQYIGGNLNPANWLRALAGVGHKVLFDPQSFGGFGGVDQRARIWVADLVKSERPELSDAQIARAVNTQLGDYNRKNWSDTQKQVGKFMLFPGWSLSSLRWVIEHPVKTTVPPALLVLAANQVLHQFGQNTDRDARDIENIHVGNRSIGLTILRESMARNLERPALNYAESKLLGESPARNVRAAGEGLVSGAGGMASTLNPILTGAASLATNRQDVFSRKELFGKGDWTTPGVVLPNKALDNLASLVVRHAFPALDRILQGRDVDFASFAGGNLGVTNYKYGPEDRLKRNAAEAAEVYTAISRLAKSDPQAARKFIQDPDNAALALFHSDLERMATTLQRINAAEQRVKSAPRLSGIEKQQHIAQMERAKQKLLRNADGLDRMLFQRMHGRRASA
ncbi:MAG: hypothetical protein WBD87_08840 [Candidatus Acidiferrales bacterium]